MDFYDKGQQITLIDDQNSGLRYRLNSYARNCTISLLNEESLEGHSPAEFFKFEGEPEIQYAGQVNNLI
jgi:hypothetical protein